ncbi:MAG: hypothetical protein KKH28_05400 [Elusimicrobia bacterium]|nr:hypothetical protein [Elusimicrobiota bacterium]
MKKIAVTLITVVFLAGCGRVKEKMSDYYLSKARKTISKDAAIPAEIERAYSCLAKSLDYDPASSEAVAALEELTDTASKGGFIDAFDLEMGVLNGVLDKTQYNWPAYLAAINSLSVRGDVYSLNGLADRLEKAASSKENRQPYETALALALCYASGAPWVESEGFLNLNKNPEIVVKNAGEYLRMFRKAEDLKKKVEKMEAADPGLKKKAPQALVSSAEVALSDIFKNERETARLRATVAKINEDPAFAKAVELTIQGNAGLIKKEYSRARALYGSALQHYPGFIDARKQTVEVDFQQGAGMALTGGNIKAAKRLLYNAYDGSDEVIEAALESPNWLPFMTRDKFLADTYAVRAAVISAIKAIEKKKLKHKAKLEKEFKAALDEAVKLNPRGKLARDLLERYAKEGF